MLDRDVGEPLILKSIRLRKLLRIVGHFVNSLEGLFVVGGVMISEGGENSILIWVMSCSFLRSKRVFARSPVSC